MTGAGRTGAIVVGAGPAGLTVAHELARRGVRVRLIDAATGPATTGGAVAVHPRTLETFAQMGVVEALLGRGRANHAFTVYAGGRPLTRLEADYATTPTSYPYTLLISRAETEDVLRAAVARLGVETEWGVRLTGVEQDPDGVRLRLTGADGVERSADSPWLIGCDGGHGTVRELLGLDLLDETGGRWMLADAPAGTGLPPDTLHWTRTSWTSVCAARRSTVPRMGEGRVFLAGNAAPVDSPAAGHAMNTGVQEAYNLAWKLAQVEQGHAGRELLDTYGQERAPAGRARRRSRRTPASAHRSGRLLVAPALSVVLALLWALPALRRTVQRRLLGGLSGLRTDYDASSLTTVESYEHVAGIGPVLLAGTVATPLPVAGERITAARIHDPDAPGCRALHGELRDPRWSLLLAAGGTGPGDVPVGVAVTAAVQYAEWLSVRTVGGHLPAEPGPLADPDGALRAALGLAPGCWLLVRPDGYVATRGAELTRTVLDHAFAPLRPRSPLIGAAPREPGIVLPAPNRRPEEH